MNIFCNEWYLYAAMYVISDTPGYVAIDVSTSFHRAGCEFAVPISSPQDSTKDAQVTLDGRVQETH